MYKVLSTFRNNKKEYLKDSLIDGKNLSDIPFLIKKGLLVKEEKLPVKHREESKGKAKK